MMNTRLSVTLDSGHTPYNCYCEHGWTVKRFNAPLTDDEIYTLVKMAGFYGQDFRITQRTTEKVDSYNKFFVYHVDTATDSGD